MRTYKLEEITDKIKEKIRQDFDQPCIISGREGQGKSVLGYHLCNAVDDAFDVEGQIAYTTSELQPKLFNTPKYGAVLVDEALSALYKREHSTKERKKIIKILSQARQRNLFYVLCCPRMGDLDEYFRNWRLRLWFHVIKRGVAQVYLYDDSVMIGDPWHLNDKKERNKRNFLGYVGFPDMPPEVKQEYTVIKAAAYAKMKDDLNEVEANNKDNKYRIEAGALIYYINQHHKIRYADILEGLEQHGFNISKASLSLRVKDFKEWKENNGGV